VPPAESGDRRQATPGLAPEPANRAPYRILVDVSFGPDVVVGSFTNLYGCTIGGGSRIGPFVEVQRGVLIGRNCKIQSHSFICEGVELDDEVFVGHGVVFVNDKLPRATSEAGQLQTADDWPLVRTTVGRRASLGSGAVILGGLTIGSGAVIGAGAVVAADVEPGTVVAGVPARLVRRLPPD
jgi:UDP-2-acetamido-3-amino-2,3-dideoxy-glucuronate N-acetyltransferase